MQIYLVLFLVFAQFGLLCFGGGNVLTPIYIDELVEGRGWLSPEEFGNLLAIAQMTPGPISVNAATFFGYNVAVDVFPGNHLAGFLGAGISTFALLLPSFILMMIVLRTLEKHEKGRGMKSIMWGVGPATIGLTIVAMMIFIEMSVFTQAIPWKALVTGATIPESFAIRPFALILFIASTWALTKKGKRLSIMAVIFISAVLGAIFLKC